MWKKSKKGHYSDTFFEVVEGQPIPLRIHFEKRNGYRASIGKKHLIFRMPVGIGKAQSQQILEQLQQWAKNTYAKDPKYFSHLMPKSVPPHGKVVIMGTQFDVTIKTTNVRVSHFARYSPTDEHLIEIELAGQPAAEKLGSITETLISRLSSQRYLPTITNRVMYLNDLHFQQPISGVTLKLTKSQWGSCSSKGNINLSSRLLLVPELTRDAVIIHELAHRIEMNHSDRFWKLVYDAMPDYDQQHAYLKKHGQELSFLPI